MEGLSVSLRGDREVRKLLDSLSGRELQNRTRRGTRAGAKVFRQGLRGRVGSGYPRAYRKLATRNHRNGSTSTGPTTPLLNIFEGGAGHHRIAPKGKPLTNFGRRREGADKFTGGFFFSPHAVMHPGVAANPLIGPEFDADHDDAASAALDKMLEGIR